MEGWMGCQLRLDLEKREVKEESLSHEFLSQWLAVGSDEVAEKLPPLLQNYKAAMVMGNGSFAVGQMIEEAFQWTSSLEASCKILFLYRLLSPPEEKEGEGQW